MNSPGAEVRIRPMTPPDLDRVTEIAQSLRDAPHWPRGVYQAALNSESTPRRIALVAEESQGGPVAGFAVACLIGPEAELESIAVSAGSQRRGLARRLFAALAGELRRTQAAEVYLEVRASNGPALGFYRSLGFEETGRRGRYYRDPEEDAVLMRLRLEPSAPKAG